MAKAKQAPTADADDSILDPPSVALPDVGDDEDGGWMTHKDDSDDLWDTSDDEDAGAPPAEAMLKRPLREVLSAIGLQGVPAKQQKKALDAQSNDWIISTHRRLNGLVIANPNATEIDDWRGDLDVLKIAADARGLTPDQLAIEVFAPPASVSTDARAAYRHEPSGANVAAVIVQIPLDEIEPDPHQARDEGADAELADSIMANGVMQPIELRASGSVDTKKQFYIVDGERRYKGALAAGLETIPATITDQAATEGDRLIRQVVRNDGKRLKPMEEARTFKRIMADKGWTIQQLAETFGRAKSTVSDRVALADVPAPFQSYFEKDQLTAAAAPILRQLADVPVKALERIAEAFGEDWGIEDAINDGKPIPLIKVERAIDTALEENLREIAASIAPEYKGKVVQVGKRKFAVDVAAYDTLVKKLQTKATPAGTPAPAARKELSVYEKQQRAAEKKRREKSELRRLQIRAIAAKLPGTLDAGWSHFLVKYLVRELTNDSLRSACKLLALDLPKGGKYGGTPFDRAILKHAEDLKGPEQIKLALQLLLASDMYVSPNYTGAADRINDAAKLAKVDLSKVKVDAPVTTKPAFNGPTGPVNKKKGARAFMQPQQVSDQLAAVVGAGPMVRTEVTKKVWAYIKRQGLQNKKERRLIDADDKLKIVFGGKKQVSMFEMTKLINKHLK